MKAMLGGTFRSLKGYNYRVWAAGALVSNIGTWMQRIAQDWIVLTELTDNNATAMGIVMALQFGPQAVLLPFTGYVADRFDRRRVLLVTQAAMGLLALGLGILTVTGAVQLWQVYGFALGLGITTAFDSTARQAFVSELVSEADLSNAVALNATSFNAARMIGPAVAGVMIAGVGSGWVFLLNAVTFGAVMGALMVLRTDELYRNDHATRLRGGLLSGFSYVAARPDLSAVLTMLFLIATFAFNFPIYISTMAVRVFHIGAGEFGFLTSAMAVGSVSGALLSAARAKPRAGLLVASSLVMCAAFMMAAAMPNSWLFGLTLLTLGWAGQTFTTTANGTIQLSTEAGMRGRVMAIYMAVLMGGTPIGAPIAGWVADTYGPRWALMIGAAAGLSAAAVGVRYLVKYKRLRIIGGRLRFAVDERQVNQ